MKNNNRKAQVTIFIIVGIIIVAAVLIFFLWYKPTYIDGGAKVGFEGCVETAVEDALAELGDTGGFVEPEFYYLYEGNRIPYFCYTSLYYKACVNQKPLLKQHFEENLQKAVRGKIDSCYNSALEDLRAQGYSVVGEGRDMTLEIVPGSVGILYDAPVVIQREGSQSFTRFNFDTQSSIYKMLMIATSIIQFETKFGDADTDSFMLYYPDLIVRKLKQGDGTTIYIIEDKISETKLQFASRSFVFPAGYGIDEGVYG